MDIKQLAYFVAVYEQHSFTHAAEELFITQQGLSKAVGRLEAELGVPLFERLRGGITPTVQGEAIYQNAKNILAEAQIITRTLATIARQSTPRLRVAVALGVRALLPVDPCRQFLAQHLGVQVDIAEYSDAGCDRAVFQGEADIGLGVAPLGEAVFEEKPFLRREMCLLVQRRHPLAKESAVAPRQLAGVPLVLPTDEFKSARQLRRVCQKVGFEPNIVFSTMDSMLIARTAEQGDAVGLAVNALHSESEQIKKLPFDPPLYWEVRMIRKKNRGRDALAEALWRELAELAEL